MRHVLILGLCFSTITKAARAGTTRVSADAPLTINWELAAPTSIDIENAYGEIVLIAVDGPRLEVDAVTENQEPLEVRHDFGETGELKIEVVYPENFGIVGLGLDVSDFGGGGGPINVSSDGSLVISGLHGRNLVINDVVVGGPRGSGKRSGAQPVRLRVGVPQALLANLLLRSRSALLRVEGPFDGRRARVVDLRSEMGRIDVENLASEGNLEVATSNGSITMSRVEFTTGRIAAGMGSIDLNEVVGNFEVDSKGGSVNSRDGAGALSVRGGVGHVDLRDPGRTHLSVLTNGRVHAEGGRGSTVIQTSTGAVTLKDRREGPVGLTAGGRVELENLEGDVKVKAGMNQIEAKGLRGRIIELLTLGGQIEAEDVEGDFHSESGMGRTTATRVNGPSIEINTSGGAVELVDSFGPAYITSGMGKTEVRCHRGGNVDVKTTGGRVVFDNQDPSVVESATAGMGRITYSRRADAESCNQNLIESGGPTRSAPPRLQNIFENLKKRGWPFT